MTKENDINAIVEAAQPIPLAPQLAEPTATRRLGIGSDVEIARRVCDDLQQKFGETVFTEGGFWRYAKTHWQEIPNNEMRHFVYTYDGASYGENKSTSCVKLNKSHIDSVLHEISTLLFRSEFFSNCEQGINCAAGFIRFDNGGTPCLIPHSPDHRCRHVLPSEWHEGIQHIPPEGSLLYKLLSGVFKGDADAQEKTDLLAEIGGAAALGNATRIAQPRAAILKGETAQNGKSQILDLFRALLPKNAISSISAAKMKDEKYLVDLAGKLLNASDELSAEAISSDSFKQTVTGEPMCGRQVYKNRFEFRPIAQHVYATNLLPYFAGGMDRGVQRRLIVVTFNRVIPEIERIEAIGQKIGKTEANFLLAWIVDGASRLIRQGKFTMPPSAKEALMDWVYNSDPVTAWADGLTILPIANSIPRVRTNIAYRAFCSWAKEEGIKENRMPSISIFTSRMKTVKGIEYIRLREGAYLIGIDECSVNARCAG